MEIRGRLHGVRGVKTFPSGFMTQDFFLDITQYNNLTGEKYENYVMFQNANERLDLTQYQVGDIVKVTFDVRGRSYDKKDNSGKGFIQNLNAYKIELIKRGAFEQPQQQRQVQQQQPTPVAPAQPEEDDDLPF